MNLKTSFSRRTIMNGKSMKTLAMAMVVAALFLAPMTGYADNYTLTNTTYTWMNDLSITYNKISNPGDIHTAANVAGTTGQSVTEGTGALPIYLKISDNGVALNNCNWFTAFCVDIYQNIGGGSNGAVSMIPVSSVQGGLQAAWLYNNYLDKAVAANDTAALGGLQVAIWEAITDPNDYNLSNGNFRISGLNSAALTDANNMLASLKTDFDPTGLNGMYAIMHSATLQDQLVKLSLPGVGDPPTSGTPEPATMILMGIGLVGLVGYKKLRKN